MSEEPTAEGMGADAERLPPCPSSPNCACSQDPDPRRRVEPWPFEGGREAVRQRLLSVLSSFPRTRIVAAGPRRLLATCRTPVLRFADDVELLIDERGGVVHVRSASRVGWSDLGANRRRLSALRKAFEASA